MHLHDHLVKTEPLTEQELMNMQEFFSPIHIRAREELIAMRAKVKELESSLKSAHNRNNTIVSKY